jgi:hypothetical protein
LIQIKARAAQQGDTKAMLKHPLARHVAFVIAAKLMAAIAVALFVFGPGQRPKIDVNSVETRLIGSADVPFTPRS